MAVSLILSVSVSYTSDTKATVKATLKAKSTSGSYNHTKPSGYITIDGTKDSFSHNFNANTTTTLASSSKTITRTTANKSITVKGYFKTGVSSGNISKSDTVTVKARPKYNVTFNANGGTNGTTVAVFSGYTTTFPYTSRTGYSFGSWNGYAQGAATPAITSARTYTASWNVINYSISYALNSGTITGQRTSYNVTTDNFTLPMPTKTGYYFTGWTGSNGSTPQRSVTIYKGSTGNRSYTANWVLNQYTVTFDLGEGAGQGSIPYNSVTKTHGETIKVPIPEWSGHIFAGWKTSSGQNIGSEECSLNGNNNGDNITLTAVWSDAARPLVIHYYKSPTDINSTIQTYKIINENITTSNIAEPTIENYSFGGWYISLQPQTAWNGTFDYEDDLVYLSTDTTVDEHKTYYRKNETEHTWDEIEEPTGNPSTSNYYELNYSDAANQPLHLYAIWKKQYTIQFNINSPTYNDGIEATIVEGQTTQIVPKTFTEDNTSISIPNSGNVYAYKDSLGNSKMAADGWALSPTGNKEYTNSYTVDATLPAGTIINLYAHWKPEEFTITYINSKNASNTILSTVAYYNEIILIGDSAISSWEKASDEKLSGWILNGTKYPIGAKALVTQNLNYTSDWASRYTAPKINDIKTQRYLDAEYTTPHPGGKYLQISAEGIQGVYEGVTPNSHTYKVEAKFYAERNINAEPVVTYKFDTEEKNNTFKQSWGNAGRPLIDTTLQMLYCTLLITDTTNYGGNIISGGKNIFTHEFDVPLERAIALHIADDVSAMSILGELEDHDTGLVVKKTGTFNKDIVAKEKVRMNQWIWDGNSIEGVLFVKFGEV